MATNKGNTGTGTTRRGFLGALGATAAAMALPAVTLGTEEIADDWRAAISAWRREYRSRLPAFRAVYRAELERFAETLRPGFAAGTFRAENDHDEFDSPQLSLENACEEHFGLADADETEAALLLDVSDQAPALADGGWPLLANWAVVAVAWDVIMLARNRGWYTPSADEGGEPLKDPVYLRRIAREA
jgi:hypothetical protein